MWRDFDDTASSHDTIKKVSICRLHWLEFSPPLTHSEALGHASASLLYMRVCIRASVFMCLCLLSGVC